MPEKRRYIRMSTVFPVEFTLPSPDGLRSRAILLQGFTRDVGEGGMCIELKSFGQETERRLTTPKLSLDLTINPTFSVHPIHASAQVVWVKKQELPYPPRYLLGVQYTNIESSSQKRLINHARRLLWLPRLTMVVGLLLLMMLAFYYARERQLVTQNSDLVRQLRESADRKSDVAEDLIDLKTRKSVLESDLLATKAELKKIEIDNLSLATQANQMSEAFMKQKEEYDLRMTAQKLKEEELSAALAKLNEGQERLSTYYQILNKSGLAGEGAAFSQMSGWLKSHQNLRTGLVASYEGDRDLEDVAYVYDQSLAAQALLLFNETQSARLILTFFKERAQNDSGAFYNAYDTIGGAPQENMIHVGPNVWLGIAALQYQKRTGDEQFLPMAERIGKWLIRLQDEEGGLRGGPDVKWHSTEHNLDAYAYFMMLWHVTQDEAYQAAGKRCLSWIQTYAYSSKENRMNRGKGDATIATDTFAWAISALGPATLKEIHFDADGIMEFAEKNCAVKVDFKREGGRVVKVRGFDFAKAQNLGRGGVISTEWTSQMIVGYQVLAKYYGSLPEGVEKAALYKQKAEFYLNELQKMVITSSSRTGQGRGCLPYASSANVDTGHGWRTPRGSSTGSVSPTAYGLFAWKGYNPFELDGGDR